MPANGARADDLDVVADLEGPEPQQHDAGGDIGERSLQGEADREARGAEGGEEGGGLHADLAQRRHERQDEDAVARGGGERRTRGLVDVPRSRQRR